MENIYQPLPPLPPSSCRELDLGGFAPLQYGPLSRTVMDSENHTKDQEELKLHPHQLLFLLRDLSDKLGLCLSAFGGKSAAARVGDGMSGC